MAETHKRTVARTVSYRLLATAITAVVTGISTAILLHIFLTLVHYIHERVWLNIEWGRS